MSTQETKLTAIADAIREKEGTTAVIPANDFPARIRGIRGIELVSIEITSPPAKTSYYAGESFDPTGMVVTGRYSNGNVSLSGMVTGYTVSPAGALAAGTTKVVITYGEGGVSKSCEQGVSVGKRTVAAPKQSGSLTYNGQPQTPVWSGYDSSIMTKTETARTDAGSSSTVFGLRDPARYQWSDGTTTAKTVAWSIGKATGSLTLSKTSVTLNGSNLTATVAVTRPGNGKVTATSSNTGVATVSVSNPTGSNPVVNISHVNQTTGNATITIKVAAGTNYTASADKTVAVTAEFLPAKKALNDTSWEDIRTISDAWLASSYWSVGDKKTIKINGTIGTLSVSNLSVDVFILGFDHNASQEGYNRIHFQIGKISDKLIAFCDNLYERDPSAINKNFVMNPSAKANSWEDSTNVGGWKSCTMRTVVLGADKAPTNAASGTFMAALPSDLRAVMKSCTKYTDNTGGGKDTASYVTATTDYLFLLAEWEYFGARTYANSAEKNYQEQYDYYKNGNEKKHYKHSSMSTTVYTWERSPFPSNAAYFCRVGSGSAAGQHSGVSSGIAPAFCV